MFHYISNLFPSLHLTTQQEPQTAEIHSNSNTPPLAPHNSLNEQEEKYSIENSPNSNQVSPDSNERALNPEEAAANWLLLRGMSPRSSVISLNQSTELSRQATKIDLAKMDWGLEYLSYFKDIPGKKNVFAETFNIKRENFNADKKTLYFRLFLTAVFGLTLFFANSYDRVPEYARGKTNYWPEIKLGINLCAWAGMTISSVGSFQKIWKIFKKKESSKNNQKLILFTTLTVAYKELAEELIMKFFNSRNPADIQNLARRIKDPENIEAITKAFPKIEILLNSTFQKYLKCTNGKPKIEYTEQPNSTPIPSPLTYLYDAAVLVAEPPSEKLNLRENQTQYLQNTMLERYRFYSNCYKGKASFPSPSHHRNISFAPPLPPPLTINIDETKDSPDHPIQISPQSSTTIQNENGKSSEKKPKKLRFSTTPPNRSLLQEPYPSVNGNSAISIQTNENGSAVLLGQRAISNKIDVVDSQTSPSSNGKFLSPVTPPRSSRKMLPSMSVELPTRTLPLRTLVAFNSMITSNKKTTGTHGSE